MKGLAERIRAVVAAPDEREAARLRAELERWKTPAAPADPRAATIHKLLVAAFQETRDLYLKALSGSPSAAGYLELAERSLHQAEELTAQAHALAREPYDYGNG